MNWAEFKRGGKLHHLWNPPQALKSELSEVWNLPGTAVIKIY